MRKARRPIIIIFLILLIGLLLSPAISLILPKDLRAHTYHRLVYLMIADRQTSGSKNDVEKALKLFHYVVRHEFIQGQPYKCKPFVSLVSGQAYCDFQARTLNALLGVAGISSRYAMLLDKDGISPHTLNEVFLDNKWAVFDPMMNIIYRNREGNFLTLQQLSDDPALIYDNPKFVELKIYKPKEYDNFVKIYSTLFPNALAPRRSVPTLYQRHIIDFITDLYFKMFKHAFFNKYQDIYLKLTSGQLKEPDSRLFYEARNLHLAYRLNLAEKKYLSLLKDHPKSEYKQDAMFFLGMLYFEKGASSEAIDIFRFVSDKGYEKWAGPSNYYLGLAYRSKGDKKASLAAFANTSIYKLSADILKELNQRKGAGLK